MLLQLFLGGCFLISVLECVPAPGHGALEGFCITNRHCKNNECCVSFVTPRGKRAAVTPLSPDLKRFVKGRCETIGSDGSKCLVRDFLSTVKGIYYHSCPCGDGYTCAGTGQHIRPIGELGNCKIKQNTCQSGSDCAFNECCVNNNRPKGKRSADLGLKRNAGHCEPMGGYGSKCLVKNGSGRPSNMVMLSCPCWGFFTCKKSGKRDMPLGELGICRIPRRSRTHRRKFTSS